MRVGGGRVRVGGRERRVQDHSAEVHRLKENGGVVCVWVWHLCGGVECVELYEHEHVVCYMLSVQCLYRDEILCLVNHS